MTKTSYALLDSGDFQRLEQVGPYRLVRQATQAFWPKCLDEAIWRQADAVHVRSHSGGGHWEFARGIPKSWDVEVESFQFKIKPTPFGHVGLFAEQSGQWSWIRRAVGRSTPTVLNLFGYTGGSTLAAARAGARVIHVDASKGVVAWARENAARNQLADCPIRWIVEDVPRFVQRELKRGRRVGGVILDPPTFGRGAGGQQWKIERDLVPLLVLLRRLADPLRFILLSCHTPGYSPVGLIELMTQIFALDRTAIECGEMTIPHQDAERVLPSGTFARWMAP